MWRAGSGSRGAYFFFFNDTATTEIYTLSLHDALPIYSATSSRNAEVKSRSSMPGRRSRNGTTSGVSRSEEHTSELQSRQYLVCRLLLEKKKATPLARSPCASPSYLPRIRSVTVLSAIW